MDLDQRRLEQGAKIFVAVKKALDNWQYRDRLGLSLSDVPSFTMAYVASEMARDDGDYLGQGTAVREPQEASADDKDNDVIPVVEYKIDEEKLASRLERFLVEYVSARQQPTVQSPTSTKHNGRVPYIALSAGFSITYDEDYDDVNEDDGDDDPEESSEEGDPEPLGGTIADGISSMMDAVFGGAPEETEEDQDVAEDDNDDDEEPSEYEIKRAAYISNRVNSAIKVFGKHGFIHTGKYQVYRNESTDRC